MRSRRQRSLGLLDGFVPFRYLADLDTPGLKAAIEGGGRLVMTDTKPVDRTGSRIGLRRHTACCCLRARLRPPVRAGATMTRRCSWWRGRRSPPATVDRIPDRFLGRRPNWKRTTTLTPPGSSASWVGLGARLDIELTEKRAVDEVGVRIARLGLREVAWVRIMAGGRGQLVEVGRDGEAVADFAGVDRSTGRLVVDDRGDGDNPLGVGDRGRGRRHPPGRQAAAHVDESGRRTGRRRSPRSRWRWTCCCRDRSASTAPRPTKSAPRPRCGAARSPGLHSRGTRKAGRIGRRPARPPARW